MSQKLIDTINEIWEQCYPGSVAVTSEEALCNRVRSLGTDRDCWVFNAKMLQKQVNKMEKNNET